MVFHWSLSDTKSSQVSRTLLSILADLYAVAWMASACPLIANSSSPFTSRLGMVPSAPITIGMTVNFMFHCFFLVLQQCLTIYLFFAFFWFYSEVFRNGEVHYSADYFFLLTITRSGRFAEIRWYVCISKSQRRFCVSFYRTDSGLVHTPFVLMVKFKLLAQFHIQSCLILHSFCANLLHLLIKWAIFLSLSPNNLHQLFFATCLFLLWHS